MWPKLGAKGGVSAFLLCPLRTCLKATLCWAASCTQLLLPHRRVHSLERGEVGHIISVVSAEEIKPFKAETLYRGLPEGSASVGWCGGRMAEEDGKGLLTKSPTVNPRGKMDCRFLCKFFPMGS